MLPAALLTVYFAIIIRVAKIDGWTKLITLFLQQTNNNNKDNNNVNV